MILNTSLFLFIFLKEEEGGIMEDETTIMVVRRKTKSRGKSKKKINQ